MPIYAYQLVANFVCLLIWCEVGSGFIKALTLKQLSAVHLQATSSPLEAIIRFMKNTIIF